MSSINIPPFNRPLSLLVACVIALVGIGFLNAVWGLATWLLIMLLLLVVGFAVAGIVLTIKYPQMMLQDESRVKYEEFRNFRRDTAQRTSSAPNSTEENIQGDLNVRRQKLYEENRGLFLVHTWRFSEDPDQVADIIISLQEHSYYEHLSILEDKVESVTYELGRRFFDEPQVRRTSEDDFALEVSAYSPMLCLAEVKFNDEHGPIYLSRYIDFPTDGSST